MSPVTSPTQPSRSRAKLAIVVGGVALLAAAAVTVATGRGNRMVDATIPAGTALVASLQGTISTENGEAGTPVRLELADDLSLGDGLVVRAGASIRGEVTHSQGGGRVAGAPELTIRFHELSVNGTDHAISAEPFRVRGKNDAAESAAMIGGGAVVGGVVGAITGAGTAEGAIAGAILGTGVAVATKGDQIVLPSGQKLRVRLTEPVTVSVAREKTPEQ
jgi:hypothetical protein